MTLSEVFEWTADALATHSSLSRTEARGTLRQVLKDAGLDPKFVNKSQMAVVVDKLLARALTRLRVEGPAEVCRSIRQALDAAELASPMLHTPEDIFSRLGKR